MKKIAIAIMSLVLAAQMVQAELLDTSLAAYWSYLDSDDVDTANGAGARLKFTVTEFVGFEARGAYMEYDEGDLTMIPVEGALTLNIPIGPLRAFAGIGGGYYFLDADAIEVDDQVGYFPLAGGEIDLSEEFFLYGEVRWLFLNADVEAAQDELEEVVDGDEADFDGLGVQVGAGVRF